MAKIRRNLTNMRFGKLVAIEYKGTDKFRNAEWLCQCDCGNMIIEKGTLLTTGKVVSCGKCDDKYNFINPQKTEVDISLVGKRFTRLLVLEERIDVVEKNEDEKVNVYMCKCVCDCGNVIEVPKNRLISGGTKSCGCLHKDKVSNTLFNLKTDKIGQKNGLLTILAYDMEQKKWKCQCDCGNIIYVKRVCKNTRSCGCLKKMTFAEREQALKGGENIE